MKQTVKFFAGTLALAFVTACSPKASDFVPTGVFGVPNTKGWPEYAEQDLSGKVFAEDWKAVTAIARPSTNGGTSLEFYPETKASACTTSLMSSKPYATVSIPSAYSVTEYVLDTTNMDGGGNPLVFSVLNGEAKNIMAEKTKVRINAITATGFNVSVYALGKDVDGTVSEVNGKIDVVDCSKVADFSVWDELVAWHQLTHFDGVAVRERTYIVEYMNRAYYDRKAGKYLKSLDMPLLYSVGANSEASYNMGPVSALGTTTVQTVNGVKTLKYSYNGPATFQGVDIQMILNVTAVKNDRVWTVTYSIEVPGHIKATTHSFTLRK